MTPPRRQAGNGQRGFTLLEVMVVVVILGILAVMVVPKIISRPDEARIIAAKLLDIPCARPTNSTA